MARTEIDTVAATRLRSALNAAEFGTVSVENEINFEVPFGDNTALSLGFNEGVVTVARVMPSGHVTGQVEFRGMPVSIIVAAVVSMAIEMGA